MKRRDAVNHPCFIVAEISANHRNDISIVKDTIRAIADTGADAVKIQTFSADTMTIDCREPDFILDDASLWKGRSLYDLYAEAAMPWDWHGELDTFAKESGLVLFSTPFDATAVDFLESQDNPIYKIASFEIADIPLIEYTASTGKPIILSTGIARIDEIHEAVEACRRTGNDDITVLKCTSSYPAPINEVNLRTMVNMKSTFDVDVGISDHTLGSDAAIAAVALGASVVEKHFILDRRMETPDAAFSMEPEEFRGLVRSIRNVEQALGRVDYGLSEGRVLSRRYARSLYFVKDLESGEIIKPGDVRSIRPGGGLPPKFLGSILGRTVSRRVARGTPVSWDSLD